MRTRTLSRGGRIACALTPIGALLAMPGAFAQTPAAPAAPASAASAAAAPAAAASAAGGTLDKMVITASRIERSGFTAPTPTTTLGAEDIEVRGAATVSSLMFELPATRPAPVAPATLQFTGGNYINLRGLGNNRTLVLVDGRRFVPTTSSGIVDTNVVPAALIERVDVVTGGASAAWGSDAVAGVTNFLFKKGIDGFEGYLQYGQAQHGGNKETAANLAWGTSYGDGRGQLMIAGEFSRLRDNIKQGDRDWSTQNWGYVGGTIDGRTYARIATPGLTLSGATSGGVITAANGAPLPATSPLRGYQFGPGGTLVRYNYGTSAGNLLMVGGDGGWISDSTGMTSPLQRQTIYGRTTFNFTPALRGSLDLSFSRSETSVDMLPYITPNSAETTPLTIKAGNPYIPAALNTILTANNIASFQVGRIHDELGVAHNDVGNDVARIAVGLDGKLGTSGSWKTYYAHGETRYSAEVSNALIMANWRAAVDVVNGPNGTPICNPATVTQLGAAAGCKPANIFGPNVMDPAVRAYVMGTQSSHMRIKQDAGGGSLQGEPFSTWAGPVSVVGGLEYRKESIVGDADAISTTSTTAYPLGGFQSGNPKPINGGYDVREYFAETVVPLLANAPGAKALDLNAALRRIDYSTSGQVDTWKLGLTYAPLQGLLLRGTQSRDIRAPNFNELYLQAQNNSNSITDPGLLTNGVPSAYSTTQVTSGNVNLKPEIANTRTLGIAFQQLGVKGLSASIDYYSIDLKQAISQLTPQAVINGCYGASGAPLTPAYCAFLTRDSAGRLSAVALQFINLQSIKTSGYDLEVAYRARLTELGLAAPGELSLRFVGSFVKNFVIADGVTSIDRAGEMFAGTAAGNAAGGPKKRFTFSTTYRHGPWTLFAQARHVGSGVVDANPATAANLYDNRVPHRNYVDASVQYTVFDSETRGKLSVFAKVNNLFDTTPPIIAEASNAPRATNFVFWDLAGRSFAAGLRYNY